MKLQFKNKGKSTGSMEIKNQTSTSADLNIFGDIVSDEWGKWSDEDTCPSDISDFLKNLDGAEEINLHINSGGGSVFGGIAIYNMLKRNKAKVTAYVDGIAASIASVVACAGDRIIIPSNGTFMIHKPTNGYFLESLNADELRKDAEILDTCQKAILQAYMEHTKEGVSEDTVNDLINAETWMVGKDVTDYFNFEVESSVNATACQSDLFNRYKHTPEDLTKKTPEDIADEVMRRLKDEKEQERKKALLEDLDFFGV